MIVDGGPRQGAIDNHVSGLVSANPGARTTAAVHLARMNLTPDETSYAKIKTQQLSVPTLPQAVQQPTVVSQPLAAPVEPPIKFTMPQVQPLNLKGYKAINAIKNPVHRGVANEIVNLAHSYIGTPYVWGGESPQGFDCSGFAQFMYGKAGISIPRTTYTQWQSGQAVGKNQLRPGDLVFFKGSDSVGGLPGHVGIYIGGGKMIDAPHTGTSVRVESVFSFGGYMGARRYGKG